MPPVAYVTAAAAVPASSHGTAVADGADRGVPSCTAR